MAEGEGERRWQWRWDGGSGKPAVMRVRAGDGGLKATSVQDGNQGKKDGPKQPSHVFWLLGRETTISEQRSNCYRARKTQETRGYENMKISMKVLRE